MQRMRSYSSSRTSPRVRVWSLRTPEAAVVSEFRVGDVETLPWPDNSFDWVTGFNAFQFADDKARALAEAGRVSKGPVAVVVPSRVADSGITAVFQQLFPLFPAGSLETMRQSGMFALSTPGGLDEILVTVGLEVFEDEELETPISFDNIATAVRAFVAGGPMAVAVQHSGESAVAQAGEEALAAFSSSSGGITLPGWYRVVLARG
jgi:SAM-dependent methyltransferase